MMALPPGCTVNFSIFIELDTLTDDMISWFVQIGGEVSEDTYWNIRGNRVTTKKVRYGKSKWSYRRQDGSYGVRLHFHGDDASAASMFLLKFHEHVQQQNLGEKYYV